MSDPFSTRKTKPQGLVLLALNVLHSVLLPWHGGKQSPMDTQGAGPACRSPLSHPSGHDKSTSAGLLNNSIKQLIPWRCINFYGPTLAHETLVTLLRARVRDWGHLSCDFKVSIPLGAHKGPPRSCEVPVTQLAAVHQAEHLVFPYSSTQKASRGQPSQGECSHVWSGVQAPPRPVWDKVDSCVGWPSRNLLPHNSEW